MKDVDMDVDIDVNMPEVNLEVNPEVKLLGGLNLPAEGVELALRCYPEPISNPSRVNLTLKHPNFGNDNLDLPHRVLVFDTETTTDQYQNLTFGSFQVYEYGNLKHRGLFYGEVSKRELAILKEYSKANGIQLMPVREFIDKVFLPEVYDAHTHCVGFNLPFDISRLAISFGNARGKNKGGFSFKLSDNPEYPRIIMKHLDSKRAFIKFANGFSGRRGNVRHKRGRPNTFKGHFLDLRTLAFALTNESHSLESACRHFKAEVDKTHPEGHGKITREYIEYNINDVRATHSLYVKALEEYEKYNLDVPPTSLYSPASIGKAYLKGMGVGSFGDKNPDFPKELLGYLMATYYGGRSEVQIRKKPVRVALIDFLSMYPTVCILQNLWRFVICHHVEPVEDTEDVRALVEKATLDTFANPEAWKQLTTIVQVQPEDDILPVRAKYGNKHTYNIGLNFLTSDKPIWFTLGDVVASKLLTGKSPKILRAIRFVPRGIQEGLQPISIVGGKDVDPSKDDLFKVLMEYRNEVKEKLKTATTDGEYLDKLQKTIKIISNATSYGIFVEINTESKDSEVMVYGNDSKGFAVRKGKQETFGRAFNPIMSVFTTSASRLVLAIAECLLNGHDAQYAFCDTDSMAVPPEHVKEIQEYFQKLSPYQFKEDLFKLEKENVSDDGKTLEPLYFYGISAKRYVLYNIRDGKPYIRKYSSHGLGHLLNPFNTQSDSEDGWHKKVWQDILDEHYGLVESDASTESYSGRYAISKIAITSPHILERFKQLNKGKPIRCRIKPFNFMLVGVSNVESPDTGKPIKPIAPYSKNPQGIVYQDCIDYNSGRQLNGIEYWKPMDSVFWEYKNHKESKFDGDTGVLSRKHLIVGSIIHIGKESDSLDETEIFGADENSYQFYLPEPKIIEQDALKKFVQGLTPKVASKHGLSKMQLWRMKRKIKARIPLNLRNKIQSRVSNAYQAEVNKQKI